MENTEAFDAPAGFKALIDVGSSSFPVLIELFFRLNQIHFLNHSLNALVLLK
jgi:hypothetical protein